MSTLVFLVALFAGFIALGMMRSSLVVWAVAAAVAVFTWQSGWLEGAFHLPSPGILGWLAWAGVAALGALAVPSIRRTVVVEPAFGIVQKSQIPTSEEVRLRGVAQQPLPELDRGRLRTARGEDRR